MAKKNEFEDEMRKSDAAAYRASLADEPGTESTRAFMKRTGTKANRPKATVGGPKIITKEQMQKAGFDNLRDYMNAQKGLKRRDNFASEAQKRAFSATPRGTQTEGDEGEAMARRIRETEKEGPSGPSFKKGGRVNENKAMKKMGRGMAKAEMQKVASKVVKGHEKRMHKKFEGGGSVSARADGCAVRGKTKCRIV